MSSEVDICNVALAHLGDSGTVASISPPEGSAQAEHCARFYPIARDAMLEIHTWDFITRRLALTLLTATNDQWLYVYSTPNKMLRAIAVIDPDAENDDDPQPFALETLSTGEKVICTNMEDAVLRYTQSITDSTKFSPAFTMALTWLLASMLAGPVIKGDVGAAEGKRCYQMFQGHLSAAVGSDSVQRHGMPTHTAPWISGR